MVGTLSGLAATPAVAHRIESANIGVLRSDILNACVVPAWDGPKIIIFSGLIKAFNFMLEFGELLSDVDRHRGKLAEVCGLEKRYLESTNCLIFTLLSTYVKSQ